MMNPVPGCLAHAQWAGRSTLWEKTAVSSCKTCLICKHPLSIIINIYYSGVCRHPTLSKSSQYLTPTIKNKMFQAIIDHGHHA